MSDIGQGLAIHRQNFVTYDNTQIKFLSNHNSFLIIFHIIVYQEKFKFTFDE